MEKIYLDAAQILAANDRPITEMDVAEWGGTIRLRPLSASDREWYFFAQMKRAAALKENSAAAAVADNVRARLLQRAIVGENGRPIFDAEEITLLGEKSETAIERVAQEALRISGMLPVAVDDAEKKSAEVPNSASPSDLH